MTMDELPRIEVVRVDAAMVICTTSFLKRIDQETAACVFDGKDFFVYGWVSRVARKATFRFEPANGSGEFDFSEGPWIIFDSYWSERIELALSRQIAWKKARFTKAGIISLLDGKVIENTAGVRLDEAHVRKQLDHEHCSICWEKLDFENSVLYHSRRYDFLCEECWTNYHEGRSIDFVKSLGDFA